jgi:serine/threonine protein kinase
MRYVEGEDLRALLDREAPLPFERALRIGSQIDDALEEAHEHGLVHRDVKSGNILVSKSDRAYLTDFGLIRRSQRCGCSTEPWDGARDRRADPHHARHGSRGSDETDITFGAGAVWLADGTGNSLTRIDPVTHEPRIFSIGSPVLRIAVDPDSGSVWGLVAQPQKGIHLG